MSLPARIMRRIRQHIAKLGDPSVDVACRAESDLVRYYGERAVESLIEACSHADPQVRYRAAWALGNIRDRRAYEAILALIQDADPVVRYESAWALGMLGDPRGIEPLIVLMNTPDPVHSVDSAAAQGLAELGTPAVPSLIRNLSIGGLHARMLAASVLGRIGDPASVEPLARLLLEGDEELRTAGLEALAEIEEHKWEEVENRGRR